jgi:AAA ATPase-like protein
MTSLLERRLNEFVDREAEVGRFCEMLNSAGKRILFVWGASGLGKSSLLARMIHECAVRKVTKAEVTWTDTRPHDYMGVMRKIRDDILSTFRAIPEEPELPAPFSPFTDLINHFTVEHHVLTVKVEGGNSISVARNASFKDANVGDIAAVLVKDVMLNTARPDMAIPEAERLARLTDRFLLDLGGVVAAQPLVVFLDAVEKMSPDTAKWLWGELLAAVRDDRLGKVVFVICGQNKPDLDRDWEGSVERTELQPLGRAHIIDYLAKRGVEEAGRELLAEAFLANTEGKISEIAKWVDRLMTMRGQGAP